MHFISLPQATALTARYRAYREAILADLYQGQNILPLSETFDRQAFDFVLAQPGCSAIRAYYGMDEDYRVHLVVVGVDAEDRDILPVATLRRTDEEEEETGIIDRSIRCPEFCPPSSGLNSDGL